MFAQEDVRQNTKHLRVGEYPTNLMALQPVLQASEYNDQMYFGNGHVWRTLSLVPFDRFSFWHFILTCHYIYLKIQRIPWHCRWFPFRDGVSSNTRVYNPLLVLERNLLKPSRAVVWQASVIDRQCILVVKITQNGHTNGWLHNDYRSTWDRQSERQDMGIVWTLLLNGQVKDLLSSRWSLGNTVVLPFLFPRKWNHLSPRPFVWPLEEGALLSGAAGCLSSSAMIPSRFYVIPLHLLIA